MRESDFHPRIRAYLRRFFPRSSIAVEVKLTKTDSIPFSSVKEHQRTALYAIKHGALTYKPPDDSRGHKPCDYIHISRAEAQVVIGYPKGFVFIDIDRFMHEDETSERRSLTWERAKAIASLVELYGR